MKIIQLLASLVLIIALSGCFSKEDPLEIERKEFTKMLEEDSPLAFYKGIKVSLRSLPINKNYNNIDSLIKNGDNEVPKHTLYLINQLANSGQDGEISIIEGIKIMKAFYDLKDELKNTDEDTYPTILEILLNTNNTKNGNDEAFLKTLNWNNSKEHLVLSTLLMAAKPLPKSFQLYEISKLDIENLKKTEVKPFAAIVKGITLMKDKWYYLAEEAYTLGINSLDNDNLQFIYDNYPSLFGEAKLDSKEEQILQLHAISCFLRGYSRTKMEDEVKNEQALEDFELFLSDSKKLELDNELVWFTGTYVNVKRGKYIEAIDYIKKFRNKSSDDKKESKAIDKIISYIDTGEDEKALNTIKNKIFIGKIVARIISYYAKEVEWRKELEKTESGRQFLALPKVVEEEYKKINSDIDTDELKEKGKELLKDIF